jgi:hypothetical protein
MTNPSNHSDLEDRLRSHYKADAERVRPRPLELDEVLRLAERATTERSTSRQQPVDGLAPIVVERRIETARRWSRPHLILAGTVAAAVVALLAGALVVATRTERIEVIVPAAAPTTVDPALAAGSVAAQEDDAPAPPVEFTACTSAGPAVQPLSVEQVSLPDGETTIERESITYRQPVRQVTDPRLEGTWYHTEDNDNYSGPGTDGLVIGTWTRRIENDEGAWQGTTPQTIDFPDGTNVGGASGPYVMIGEGAYAGLTALLTHSEEGCPNTRGYIFEGSIPSAPAQPASTPQTSRGGAG